MYELDEKKYLVLLFLLPILVVLFIYNQYWKRKKQREFGDLEMVKKLSPEKSIFKPILKFTTLFSKNNFVEDIISSRRPPSRWWSIKTKS